jgi:homoserine/homoserine lactone efflux protein
VAAISDSAYALLAARTARLLTRKRARLMSQVSGSVLIGGGLWLAFSRSR